MPEWRVTQIMTQCNGLSQFDIQFKPLAYGCGYSQASNFDVLAGQFQSVFGYARDFYRITISSGSVSPGETIALKYSMAEVTIDLSE